MYLALRTEEPHDMMLSEKEDGGHLVYIILSYFVFLINSTLFIIFKALKLLNLESVFAHSLSQIVLVLERYEIQDPIPIPTENVQCMKTLKFVTTATPWIIKEK